MGGTARNLRVRTAVEVRFEACRENNVIARNPEASYGQGSTSGSFELTLSSDAKKKIALAEIISARAFKVSAHAFNLLSQE